MVHLLCRRRIPVFSIHLSENKIIILRSSQRNIFKRIISPSAVMLPVKHFFELMDSHKVYQVWRTVIGIFLHHPVETLQFSVRTEDLFNRKHLARRDQQLLMQWSFAFKINICLKTVSNSLLLSRSEGENSGSCGYICFLAFHPAERCRSMLPSPHQQQQIHRSP